MWWEGGYFKYGRNQMNNQMELEMIKDGSTWVLLDFFFD